MIHKDEKELKAESKMYDKAMNIYFFVFLMLSMENTQRNLKIPSMKMRIPYILQRLRDLQLWWLPALRYQMA